MSTQASGDPVEIEHLERQPVVCVRTTGPVADLPTMVGDSIAALGAFLRQQGIQPAGPPYVRYHAFGETETDFELGVPVAEPIAGAGRIEAGELAGGAAVSTWHIGPHEQLGAAYTRIQDWLKQQHREPDGPAREVYQWLDLGQSREGAAMPDPATWRTQLVQLIK